MSSRKYEIVDIRLDAQEILDRIDDMLAWEAIASQSAKHYEWAHFCRADPIIKLDRKVWGKLLPNSVEATDVGEESESDRIDRHREEFAHYNRILPAFLERKEFSGLTWAQLVEQDVSDEIMAKLDHLLGGGDDVDDMAIPDGTPDYWMGARYHLESMGEMLGESAKTYRQLFKLPQVARLFRHQHVLAFKDGRAANGATVFAYWNQKFFDLNRMPLVHRLPNGIDFHFEQLIVADMIGAAVDRRQKWTVEMSLGKRRTGIGLSTDAHGALELANMLRGTDTPGGRRKTMIHWVNEHMRRVRRMDPEATVKVRAHFRGKQSLEAGRYHLRIWPSTELIAAACNGQKAAHPEMGGA